jgi:hypothetical protein
VTTVSTDKTGRVRFMVVPASYVALLRDGENGPEVLLQLREGAKCRACGQDASHEDPLDFDETTDGPGAGQAWMAG